MTQEEKQLLVKDLSARLPYGVKIIDEPAHCLGELFLISTTDMVEYETETDTGMQTIYNIKPYLRPMSSMTEEEKLHVELKYGFFYHDGVLDNVHIFETMGTYDRDGNYDPPSKYREQRRVTIEQVLDFIHWLNSHHFDYRGLIEKGLALEALEGMYEI